MNKLTLSTVSTALLLAFVSGCSGSEQSTLSAGTEPEPGAIDPSSSEALVAELDASEETTAQHGIQRWEVRDTTAGRITRGVGPDDTSIVEFAVDMNQPEANDEIVLDTLAPGGGSVTLRDGKVTSADNTALGEQALALFQDATSQAAHLAETPQSATEAGLGTLESALVAGVYSADTGEVAYDGGCYARTRATFNVGTAASDLSMTTNVTSTYLFGGCQAKIRAVFPTSFGFVVQGPSFIAGACAILDPTCPPTRQTGPVHFADPVGFSLMPFVNSFKVEQSRP